MRAGTALWLGVITLAALVFWPALVLPAVGVVMMLAIAIWAVRGAVRGRRWVR
ncbi:hypothetical protein ACH498_25030 [Rhodococcus erythropolis]